MLTYLLPIVTAGIAGVTIGALLAWWLLRPNADDGQQTTGTPDPWLNAEIDQAAATWAVRHGQPEAAPLMAEKLRLLHHLGQRPRRQP